MKVRSLGSGSSGNALLVESGGTCLLVDAGFPPRTLFARLRAAGIKPGQLTAILLTHEHTDHTQGAAVLAREWDAPIISAPETLRQIVPTEEEGGPRCDIEPLAVGTSLKVGSLDVSSFPVSHDAIAPCGYLISSQGWRVCVAIDTGMAQGPLLDALRAAQLLVLEANHDHERLLRGPYPWHLKKRILSPTGHLSNDQAADALETIVDDTPRWVWLAHLSRTNNTPDLARANIVGRMKRLGASSLQPDVLPPGPGLEWDSAALWNQPLRQERP
jgi:phosphoribosyl 1,2-cyclic phosphodiesterase